MQTLKTAIVVVLLLFVIYGGFVAINGTNTTLNPELENLVDLDTTTPDISGVTGPFTPSSSPSTTDPWAAFNTAPSSGFTSTPATPAAASSVANSPLPPLDASAGTATFPTTPILGASSTPSHGLLTAETASPASTTPASTTPATAAPATSVNASLPSLPSTLPSLPLLSSAKETKEASDTSTPDFGIALPASSTPSVDSASTTLPNLSTSSPESAMKSQLATSNDLTSSSGAASDAPSLSASAASQAYENAKEIALEKANRGQLKEALATLSVFHNAKELTNAQRQDLLDLLDALAGEVVYSREHFLEIAYVAGKGETLEQISKRYQVPAELLARINAVEANSPLAEGTKIKVVPGPFRAEVDLQRNELTVFVRDLYAGRYPISTGSDPQPKPGDYQVIDKQRDRNYYGTGAPIAGTDPRNPYGGYWIDLGQELCIHGTSESGSGNQGCISLAPMDASDVFGMLARGSQITIRR
ncbi:MAG: L,D-transpeptidase family protein [Pirellula sp.]